MRKACSLLFLFSLFLILTASYLNCAVSAESATSSSSYIDIQIEHVDQVVQILNGGSVVINDTVRVSPKPGRNSVTLEKFSIGFPYELNDKGISDNLDYCFAYSSSHPNTRVDVVLDAGLGRIGFYGIDVIFRDSITVNDGASCNFTVVFVFSNLISSRQVKVLDPETMQNVTETWCDVDFPLYPSLTNNASVCNVTLILPPGSYSLPPGLQLSPTAYSKTSHRFNRTSSEPRETLSYPTSPIQKFTNEPAWLTFIPPDDFLVVDVNEIRRDIILDEWGHVGVSDLYHITNKADETLSTMKIRLPEDVYGLPSAWDDSGDLKVYFDEEEENMTITLRNALGRGEKAEFTLGYGLPWKNYVSQPNWRTFNLASTFFEHFNWTIRKLTLTITLPEGASFQFSKPVNPYSVKKSGLQETITFNFFNVTLFHDLHFDLTYEYIMFWSSFRPTLWMGLLVTAVCIVAFLWRVPKPPPVPVIPVSPKALRSFVDTYERKISAIREIEMLGQQVRKRKIPRRRYRMRKKALESRLSVLSGDLTDLREEIRKASSRYANIMRQIEVAETELEETEAAIRRIELRYRRRDVSKGTYRNLLEKYNRGKERAETTIDEVLLRLREEIR